MLFVNKNQLRERERERERNVITNQRLELDPTTKCDFLKLKHQHQI